MIVLLYSRKYFYTSATTVTFQYRQLVKRKLNVSAILFHDTADDVSVHRCCDQWHHHAAAELLTWEIQQRFLIENK